MEGEQLSFLHVNVKESKEKKKSSLVENRVSDEIISAFSISSLPFFGCDYDEVYPQIARLLPAEKICFSSLPFETAMQCEIICAGICHQMNWDFLRGAVLKKTQESPSWVTGLYLKCIQDKEVAELFKTYSKPERIRADERAEILRSLGEWLISFDSAKSVFTDSAGTVLDKKTIRSNLLSCPVFSNDPEEKKLQLLLQKLSVYSQLDKLRNYCEPAIDYHLIRCYLRRGLLYPNSKHGSDYLKNMSIKRKESTVAAVRQLCSELLINICEYTDLDILTVNQIEWHIGRSVCVQNEPDCFLEKDDAKWLTPYFSKCPFINTCCARCYNNDLLNINEPTYLGSSY